ncbi:THAP domain-containing protein 2 [Anabarilius grahami]|uniref:THAP domain-containing protein 2 n=1 Tax=Anabarilius grahami TaxID=495550 RepID=A0A3N0Y773_ANAGA|nr:THAP domain-containing protein 2 [Anabarilius grahami]
MSLSKPIKYQKRNNPNSDFCCVPKCAISGKFNSTISFHHFPKDETLRKIWIRNVRRENLVIKRTTTVCSRHFVSTDVIQGGRRRLKEGAVPVLFAWNDYSLPAASVWERRPRPEDGVTEKENMDVELLLQCHDYDAKPEPSALDIAYEKIEAQQLVIEELRKRLEEVTLKQSFGLERFSASDDDIRFYTRFASYRHLQAFWRQIEPATRRIVRVGTQPSTSSTTAAPDKAADLPRHPSRCLPLIDELFLFLVYLSLGLKEKDLGDRFNIHQSAVSRIIKSWVNFLYTLLGAVRIWMSPEEIRATMPSVFGKYSDTQVIVDCTELRCKVPSSLLLQSETFSQCKSHATLKGMIGVSPHGAVTFVSSLYPGSVSDKELFRQSGIIPLLDKDMAVMVDEGFRIDDLVPCKVYRPPFQLSHDEVLVTQDIARLRIHVERIIQRIKEIKLFDTIIPLTISGSINQLFEVACLLTNYQNKPLVKAWAKELTLY